MDGEEERGKGRGRRPIGILVCDGAVPCYAYYCSTSNTARFVLARGYVHVCACACAFGRAQEVALALHACVRVCACACVGHSLTVGTMRTYCEFWVGPHGPLFLLSPFPVLLGCLLLGCLSLSRCQRAWYRNILMVGFHFCVLLAASSGVRDTQVGCS